MRTIPEKRILEEALAKTVEKRTLHEHADQEHKDQGHKDDDKLVLEMAENFMALVHKYGRKGVETLLSGRLH